MTDFRGFYQTSMDRLRAIQQLLSDHRPGHIWTGRLELCALLDSINQWVEDNDPDLEAFAFRSSLRGMPAAQYTAQQCIDALKAETKRFAGARSHADA